MVPSSSSTLIASSSWRCPISQSLGSCAGVTLTTPVPNSGSTYSSATTGMLRSAMGRRTCLPTRCAVALVLGMHRHGGVAEHGFRARGGDGQAAGAVLQRVADVPQMPSSSVLTTSRSDTAVCEHRVPVHQPLAAVDEALARTAARRPR